MLVVNTYPSGSFEELIPVLRWRQKNVFVFREQRRETFQSSLLLAALPLYDRLIVPHDELAAVGELPEPGKAIAVGPILIRERKELLDRNAARSTTPACLPGCPMTPYCYTPASAAVAIRRPCVRSIWTWGRSSLARRTSFTAPAR